MNRALDLYCRALSFACAVIMAVMLVLVFGNVVLRYFFQTSWLISEELSRWLFVWMVFIGAIVALRERGHLGTDMVLVRLPAKARRACVVVAHILMLYITWLMLLGSWDQTVINTGTEAPVSGFPVSVFYFCGVVFSCSALVVLAYDLWRLLTGRVPDHELVMIQESEELAALPVHQELVDATDRDGRATHDTAAGKNP
ncbi:TRAP transporter small permease [Pigmentiphaga aceris]|uniref:TRAP transporter small permease protein n=1 Tax=Pigmentiphaga aceris TaxID=1940612 RepID=A0A5C0B2W3_9BURK|nr:TRAP transporter small permease [Pigmentiphaga aceris]QEI07540.1 TRAP transporter small permease [Pigmentiphaga aceris]